MPECKHTKLNAKVATRIGGGIWALEIDVSCAGCGVQFRFKGAPTIQDNGLKAFLPLKPGGDGVGY